MIVLRATLSALHVLALALGFAGVTLRGQRLRELRNDRGNAGVRAALLRADNLWGLAALLWIATGMARAFAGLEKTPDSPVRRGADGAGCVAVLRGTPGRCRMKTLALFLALAFALAAPSAGAPVSPAASRVAAPSVVNSEASFEYLIGLAGALTKGDNTARLRALEAQLEALLGEKKTLLGKLADAQKQESAAEAAGDHAKAQALAVTIQNLQASLAKVEGQIHLWVRDVQKIQEDERRREGEAKRAAETLRKFEGALLESPPRDPFVKTLSPSAREAALGKARKGHDALANVARVASQTAALASAAAADAAQKQRDLLAQKEKLRAEQEWLEKHKGPTPTPTRPVSRGISTMR